jgi:hypothetical protein
VPGGPGTSPLRSVLGARPGEGDAPDAAAEEHDGQGRRHEGESWPTEPSEAMNCHYRYLLMPERSGEGGGKTPYFIWTVLEVQPLL